MPFLAITNPSTPFALLCSPNAQSLLGPLVASLHQRGTHAGQELSYHGSSRGQLKGWGMSCHRVTGEELQCHHMVKNHHVPLISFCLSGTCLGFQKLPVAPPA